MARIWGRPEGQRDLTNRQTFYRVLDVKLWVKIGINKSCRFEPEAGVTIVREVFTMNE